MNREYLMECFEYDETSPTCLRWKDRPRRHFATSRAHTKSKILIGAVAGRVCNEYWRVRLGGSGIYCHRIAWIITNGDIPEGMNIDHRNGNGRDNRIANLRVCRQRDNVKNHCGRKHNACGLTGVMLTKKKRWRAYITKDGVGYFLGYHDTKEQAHARYLDARSKLFGEFDRSLSIEK